MAALPGGHNPRAIIPPCFAVGQTWERSERMSSKWGRAWASEHAEIGAVEWYERRTVHEYSNTTQDSPNHQRGLALRPGNEARKASCTEPSFLTFEDPAETKHASGRLSFTVENSRTADNIRDEGRASEKAERGCLASEKIRAWTAVEHFQKSVKRKQVQSYLTPRELAVSSR